MSHSTGTMAKPSVDLRRKFSSTCGAYLASVIATCNEQEPGTVRLQRLQEACSETHVTAGCQEP